MAKMSTRALSFILTVAMLVTMLSCITFAQYDFSEVQAVEATYGLAYDYYVGPENQSDGGVYVINEDWSYDEDNYPEEVTFTFRDEEVTETYDPNRHFSTMADANKHALAAGYTGNKVATYILTEGIYTFNFTTRYNAIILGPKAGYDPNVKDADPTKEWALSSDRYLPAANSTVTGGEAVLRPNATDKMLKIDNDGNADVNLVVDGVVFQGNGAGIGDETYRNGGTVHKVYVQNSIMDNAHASAGRGSGAAFGFDMRNSQEHEKHLYLSNLYITNQSASTTVNSNTTYHPLYSGHANVVKMNGCSYQNSKNQPFNTVNCIQWQGQITEVTNSHFWNPAGVSVVSGTDTGYFLNAPHNAWNSNAKQGNDEVEFSTTVRNNTFYNMGSPSRPMFRMGMAGNSIFKMEDNTFIDTENHATHSVFTLDYVSKNGKITHVGIGGGGTVINGVGGQGDIVTEGNYLLDESRVSIQNNTFIGREYQTIVDIGNNTHPETVVQQKGNLYLDSLNSTEGNIVQPATDGAKAYNQWVWLDAAMTKSSDEIFESDVTFTSNGADIPRAGYTLTLDVGAKEYNRAITVTTNDENGARVYASDAQWVKGSAVGGTNGTFTLDTSARVNYYIVSITSIDGRTELDYKLTVNREPNPDAQILNVIPVAGTDVTSNEKTETGFSVHLNYYQQDLPFTLELSAGASVSLRKGYDLLFPANGVYTVQDTKVNEPIEVVATVTGSDGLRETFIIEVVRDPNTETELLNVESTDARSVEYLGNNTFYVEVANAVDTATLNLTLSPDATAQMREPAYNSIVAGANGAYTITDIVLGESTYKVEVLAQDGINTETWYITVKRDARTECALIDIAGADKVGNVYFAFTANKNYMVSASCSAGASYTVYKDADCTEAYPSTYIALTGAATTVWIRVVAEDGVHQSAPIKLVISSYADFGQVEDGVVKLPEVNDSIISIDGGIFEVLPGVVVIPLAAETEAFEFQARPRSGYDIRVMSDATEKPMRPDETSGDNVVQITLKPDAGYTYLYATASKYVDGVEDIVPYTIIILSPKRYTYTDTQTPWAVEYIEDVASNGYGLMKGDQNSAFNGEKLITRFEMAALMVRVAGANAPLYTTAKNPFSDVDSSHWAINYVKAAYRMGLINGYETTDESGKVTDLTYQGENSATRSEFFRIYANTMLGMSVEEAYELNQKEIDKFVKAQGFKDLDQVADWAKPAVYYVIFTNLVQGDPDKNIKPESNITRNEVAAIISRSIDVDLYEGNPFA